METPRESNWQLYMFLTVLFNGLFSLTVWKRILPRAVLFEGQSWQLVDLTFSSYVQSSFHSKVKLLLLAVTFTCGSLSDTVKKWKPDPRLIVTWTVRKNGCSEETVSVLVSLSNKDCSNGLLRMKLSHLPLLIFQPFCLLSPYEVYLL